MRSLTFYLLLSIPFLSCAKQEPPKQPEPPQTPQPAAEVSFVKGRVLAFANGAWAPAAIGQKLLAVDSINIPADASCELTDTAGRTVKLSGINTDEVSALLATGGQAQAPKPMIKALASVKKMSSKTKFQVTTPTAVAGVRGTKGRQPLPDTARQDTSSNK